MTLYRTFLLAGLVLMLGACSKSEPSPGTVSGKVTLDGQPMPEGKIIFYPPGDAPAELDIKDGVYQGKAKPGLSTVRIGIFKKGTPPPSMPESEPPLVNTLPAKYHAESKLTADVKAGESNEFNFDVTSK